MDKRIQRTRKLLGNALIDLLQQEPYHQINIRKITDEANVAYSTFFRNFESIEDLLLSYLQDFLYEIKQLIKVEPKQNFRESSRHNMMIVFEHVAHHADKYRVLLTVSAARPILTTFQNELVQYNLGRAEQFSADFDTEKIPPFELILTNAISQLFTIIEWWLEQDNPPSSDEMAHYYEQLVTFPMWRLLLTPQKANKLFGIPHT